MEKIIVIGAGIIGSAVAMGLGKLGADVTVVDVDLEGRFSSSELNAGGVRATFNQPVNIAASKVSIDYFASIAEEIGFRECGYLWLCNEEQRVAREKSLPLWQKHGWPVEVWSPAQIASHYPLLDQLDGVSCGLFGRRDGILNTNLLKMHYRNQAKLSGVRFLDRHLLRSSERGSGAKEFRLSFQNFSETLTDDHLLDTLSGKSHPSASHLGKSVDLHADVVVNCAGAWAGEVARILGYETKCIPIRRQISLFDSRAGNFSDYGMIVDTSGVYFHPESTFILSGVCERDEPNGVNFSYGGEDFFQEKIWMPLSERSSAFQELRHISGWAGLYETSPDDSGIIGSSMSDVFEAHSFSGHGVMHSYAVGIALAEKILHRRYESFDFSELAGERFQAGKLVSETAVI